MNIEVAEKIGILMLQINSKLNDSIAYVRDNCSQDEFETYKRSVGKIMGSILIEIENPIFEKHPSLMPDGLGGPNNIDPKIFEPRFYEYKP
jgi:hypothetical protein